MLLAIAIAATIQAQPTEELRPRDALTSQAYRDCMANAASMADERGCMSVEVERAGARVADAMVETGADAEGHALWRASVEHDCRAEYDLAQGSNSADMRRMACLIELRSERAAYLQRRLRW